jgi:type I restriction enzyme S subunit
MSFPRYPKYKDSSVEWLGEVPEHWDVRRLRQIGPLLKGCGGSKEDVVETGVPCVRYGDLYTTHAYMIRQARTCVTEERAADYFPIRRGDVLFAASGEDLAEIGRSAVVLVDERACCGGDLVVLRPDVGVVPEFMGYACDCSVAKSQKASMGRGTTVKHIYPDELKRLLLAVPPLPEQAHIASFLDRETAKIDALIAEQQRLIELLQEKRQAVISHAVTKGLNPDALMKDSGIEWLGEVPEHWTLTRLDRISDFVNGKAHEPHVSDDGQFICVTSRFISTNGEAVRLCAENLTPAVRDDILMVMSDLPNGRALARTFHVQDERDYAINQRVCAIRPTGASPRYLAFMLDRNPWFLQNDDGLNQTHLSVSDFRKMPIVLPPQGDQDAIAQRLDSLVAISAHLIAHAETCITLLQERRAALISAAVTGQIDVRGFSTGGSEAA